VPVVSFANDVSRTTPITFTFWFTDLETSRSDEYVKPNLILFLLLILGYRLSRETPKQTNLIPFPSLRTSFNILFTVYYYIRNCKNKNAFFYYIKTVMFGCSFSLFSAFTMWMWSSLSYHRLRFSLLFSFSPFCIPLSAWKKKLLKNLNLTHIPILISIKKSVLQFLVSRKIYYLVHINNLNFNVNAPTSCIIHINLIEIFYIDRNFF